MVLNSKAFGIKNNWRKYKMSIDLMIKITMVATILLGFVIPFTYFFKGNKNKKRYKNTLVANIVTVAAGFLISLILAYSPETVSAAGETAAESQGLATGLGYIAAAFATGLSGIGGGIAVASAASAALGAISEDDSIFGRSLIFVGLAEGIALYGLIISFMILGRL